MAKWGFHAEAVATLLAFDCLLRVGELTRLRYHDVVMPNDARLGSAHTGMVVRLARTKTGLNQSVSLANSEVQAVLRAYLLDRPFLKNDLIFPFSPASFRLLIREVASVHGLGSIAYVPHSFRHGGATYLYQRGVSIQDIMFRGRWVALESTRRYVQTARALLIMLDIPSRLHKMGLRWADCVVDLMTHLMSSVPSATARRDRRVWFRLH